jgi:hypothetical protein
LTSNDKFLGFKKKPNSWENHVATGNLETFPPLPGLESEGYQKVLNIIENHLEEIRNKIKPYFPSLSTHVYDWVGSPYPDSSAQPENLTLREQDELCELQSYRTLWMRFTDLSLDMEGTR